MNKYSLTAILVAATFVGCRSNPDSRAGVGSASPSASTTNSSGGVSPSTGTVHVSTGTITTPPVVHPSTGTVTPPIIYPSTCPVIIRSTGTY